MRRLPFLVFLAVAMIAATAGMRAVAQNTPGGDQSQGGEPGGGSGGGGPGGDGGQAGPGGPGGGPPPPGYHLLPRFAMEKLNLTDDQTQQLKQLEKDTKAKLAKILTADQMKTLDSIRPPHPAGGGGPDNQQGGSGGGGPGGDQGPPN